MKGSKHLRGMTWSLQAYAGTQVDPVTGKTTKKWIYASVPPVTNRRGQVEAATERKADDALAKLVVRATALRDGGVATPAKRRKAQRRGLTVREAFEQWRIAVGPGLEPNGRDQDRHDLENYVYPHIGHVALWQLRPAINCAEGDLDWNPDLVSMTAFYRTLTERGSVGRPAPMGSRTDRGKCLACGGALWKKDHQPECPIAYPPEGSKRPRVGAGGPLAPATVTRVAGTCQRALAWCVTRNWISSNPATGATVPTVGRRPSTIPGAVDFAGFLRFVADDDPELFCFIHAIVYAGGRRLDIGVQWPEVNFDEGSVDFVGRAVITAKSGGGEGPEEVMVRTTPTKKRKPRVASILPEGIQALRDHHARAMQTAFDCGIGLLPDAYVFSHEPDGSLPCRPDYFTKQFARARKRAAAKGVRGMAKVRLYDCRHLLITQLKAARVPDSVIAERCGNSERTMDEFYRGRVSEADKAATEALGRVMREADQKRG